MQDLYRHQFSPSCFYTWFNGPLDPGFCGVAHANYSDPLTLSHTTKRPDWSKWQDAIQENLKALGAFNTFEVVPLPRGKKLVGCK